MPSTYNGIGTHYYGKTNIQKRPGPCPHCHRAVELTSYDTRLWFVVVFIPIIPIRRKRIIDYCPACTRHFAADLEKWETAKQLEMEVGVGAWLIFKGDAGMVFDPDPDSLWSRLMRRSEQRIAIR